ncbi:hypothetical protein AAF712_004558 [Marasmius tenuissimus]|uniref:Uncharacterized protein n=1 Tax=Marasmius tenuissimus TaxID=585030 RepID=A0ABR3A4Q6_9AGAR
MSTTSTTPPPSYTSQDKGKERDDRGSVAEKEEGGVDRGSGHSPSRRSHRSSRSAGDDNEDKKSTRSRGERRRPHRSSSRHRHSHHDEDKDKAPSEIGHAIQSAHGDGPHDDQKSIKTVGTKRSHRSSRHHDHHSHRDDEKAEARLSTHPSHGGDDNGDKRSTRSLERRQSHRSSRHHRDDDVSPSEIASLRDVTDDDLRRIAQSHMRRSQCGPEFLKELAENGVPEDLQQDGQQKFRVVTGAEARSIYNEVIKEDEKRRLHHHHTRDITPPGYTRDHRNHNVVFAFPVHVPTPGPLRAGGRKVVDYYMTWKGKTGTHRLKGRSRKNDFLEPDMEPEFRKIAHGLDEHNKKRLSRISTSDLKSRPADESRPPITTSQSAPPAPLSMLESKLEDPLTPPKPPFLSSSLRDSNPSVLSLPNLGFSLPLRVTNPDPASSSGTESIRASIVATSAGAKKSPKKHADPSKASGKHTSTLEPVAEADERPDRRHRHKHHRSKRRELNSSSESISASSSTSSSGGKDKRSKDEILIVLMDSDTENDKRSKLDGLRRSKSAKLPTRRTSTRNSPWNAPAATSNGNVHRYVPGTFDETNDFEEEESSEDEEDEEIPSIPMKAALKAMGLHPHNNSMPNLSQPSPHVTLHSQPSPHISLHSQPQLPTPASLHPSLPPVSHFHRSATLPTPVTIHQSLPPTSPYHLNVATELYKSPYSFSAPNLPNIQPSPASAGVGISSPNSSYVMPWVASTPILLPPGSLSPSERPAASPSAYNSPYVPPAQAPYSYTPVQVYSPPAGTMNRSSPYVGMSGAGGGTVPLPTISIYAGTPLMAQEAQLY